ncbi:MAG TPA: helix-turn-helix transcriptional regulator [Gaiellaceae bacterium]
MSAEKQRLGERIRAARTAKGWKQKHLAAEVAVEPITVSRWERGATSPDLEVIHLVADATDKPVSFFVGEGQPETSADPSALERAAGRIEAAALQLATEADRIEALLADLSGKLDRLR